MSWVVDLSDHADIIRTGLGPRSRAADAQRQAHFAVDALVAENRRMRDALERIKDVTLFEEGNGVVVARKIARAALDGTA